MDDSIIDKLVFGCLSEELIKQDQAITVEKARELLERQKTLRSTEQSLKGHSLKGILNDDALLHEVPPKKTTTAFGRIA